MTIRPFDSIPFPLALRDRLDAGFVAALVFLGIALLAAAPTVWGLVLGSIFFLTALAGPEGHQMAVASALGVGFIVWGLVQVPFYCRRLIGRSRWDIAGWSSTFAYNAVLVALGIWFVFRADNAVTVMTLAASGACALLAGVALIDAFRNKPDL